MSNSTMQLLCTLNHARIRLQRLTQHILSHEQAETLFQYQYQEILALETIFYEKRKSREEELLRLWLNTNAKQPANPNQIFVPATVQKQLGKEQKRSKAEETSKKALSKKQEPGNSETTPPNPTASEPNPTEAFPKPKPKMVQRRLSRKRLSLTMAKALEEDLLERKATTTDSSVEISTPTTDNAHIVETLSLSDLEIQESDFELPNFQSFENPPKTHEELLLDLNDAIDKDPKDPWLRIERAKLFEANANWICAISDYLRAAETLPSIEPWVELQRIYSAQGLTTKAAQAAIKIQQLSKPSSG